MNKNGSFLNKMGENIQFVDFAGFSFKLKTK